MRQVEWGDTEFIVYTCQAKVDDVWTNVTPDNVYAVSESYATKPVFIESLSCETDETGIYVAKFFADKTKYNPKTVYYVTLYWHYNDVQKCERVPVSVKSDVRA